MKIFAGLPTGVSAALFDSVKRRRRLEARLTALLEERGFGEVLLPILDYFEPYRPLLQGRRLEQLYRFVDRDGQLLVLRGDFTPMLARLLAPLLDDLELPLRLYYRGDVVRHQPLRPGRMREYSQLGAELLGGDRTEADFAVLTLFLDLLLQARGDAPATAGVSPAPGNRGRLARIRRRRRAPGRPRHRRRARRALALGGGRWRRRAGAADRKPRPAGRAPGGSRRCRRARLSGRPLRARGRRRCRD